MMIAFFWHPVIYCIFFTTLLFEMMVSTLYVCVEFQENIVLYAYIGTVGYECLQIRGLSPRPCFQTSIE